MVLRIAKKYWNDENLKKELGIIGYVYSDIDYANYKLCNIAEFRKYVHTIIDHEFTDLSDAELKQEHDKVSNNDFTVAILKGIVEVVPDEQRGVMSE